MIAWVTLASTRQLRWIILPVMKMTLLKRQRAGTMLKACCHHAVMAIHENCCASKFYRLDALPVAEPIMSKYRRMHNSGWHLFYSTTLSNIKSSKCQWNYEAAWRRRRITRNKTTRTSIIPALLLWWQHALSGCPQRRLRSPCLPSWSLCKSELGSAKTLYELKQICNVNYPINIKYIIKILPTTAD